MRPRGEKHHKTRLTDAQVEDMRKTYSRWREAGSFKGYGWLAYIFGVSKWTVRDIVTYRTRT